MLVVTVVGDSREGAGNQLLPSVCGRERKLPCQACPTLLLRVFQAPAELHAAVACRRQPVGLMESCRPPSLGDGLLAALLVTPGTFPFSADPAA